MSERSEEVEESFRASLEDVLVVIQRLEPHCKTINDLTGAIKAAIGNDAVLRMLIKETTKK